MKISDAWKNRFTHFMQLSLFVLVMAGIYMGSTKVVTNAGIGLIATFVPALLERNYSISTDPFLSLWITSAVFFHSLGSFGFYGAVWWWDHLTHALSASLVAGVGYTVVRSIDLHTEEINLPNRFMFVFILMTVIAFGVVWELFEFGLDILADMTGWDMPLAQHGLDDTMKDMMFNTLGAVVAAVMGQTYLNRLAHKIRR